MKTALVTGATSGIGEATSKELANIGFNLIICGRREEKLQALKQELSQVSVRTACFDVRDKDECNRLLTPLIEETGVDLLINNAGNAHGLSPIQNGDIDDWESMIDINVKGLLYVSKVVMPQMITQKSGHIINIGSIAGKEVYPNGSVYCASKHAVDAINNGMRIDLNPHGIKVSQVSPGLVETEFSLVRFKGNKEKADAVYDNMQPLVAKDIADIIKFMALCPSHVNISDLIVLPTAQAGATIVNRSATS